MHRARRRFGQNFLVNAAVIDRIVGAVAPRADQHLVEIGPGRGALTGPLLAACGRLSVVEIDRDLAAELRARHAGDPRFELIEGDALKLDFDSLQPQPLRVVGNLPYNISTPLLFHLLNSGAAIADLHLMLQKEVVDRILAAPGSGDYGRLSVAAQLRCDTARVLRVGPGNFSPAPRVDSAVIRLTPREHVLEEPVFRVLDQLLKAGFSARRKTLRNALRGLLDEEALRAAGVDPGARPETLAPERWAALAQRLADRS